MRLRTLKKLSKAAAPILATHYGREIFLAERGDSYHGLKIHCHCPKRLRGNFGRCGCQSHPLKGTPMVGEMSGYYEREWDERTAYEELRQRVLWEDRPKGASDAQWREIMRIARVTAADQREMSESLEAWAKEEWSKAP